MRIFLYIFLFFSLSSYALDTKVSIELTGPEKAWDVGEIKDFKLMLYPISEVNDDDFKKSLLMRDFADIIKVIRVKKQNILKENPEYYIVEATGVLINKPKSNFPLIWDYRGMAVAVDYDKIKFSNIDTPQKSFFVYEKKLNENRDFIFWFLLSLFFVFGVSIIVWLYRRRILSRKIQADWNKRVDFINNAKDRYDHESIYKRKEEFYEIFSTRDVFNEYLKHINKIQYKKTWTDNDLMAINEGLEKAKEKIVVK